MRGERFGDRGGLLKLDGEENVFFAGESDFAVFETPIAMSCSRSCDVDVNPSRFMRAILLAGDSSASMRGAFALSSSCIKSLRSSAREGPRDEDVDPPRKRRRRGDVESSSFSAFSLARRARAFSVFLRSAAAASLFWRAASAAASRRASSCTLSNVTRKSATSLKMRPPLSGLNGSPKNSVALRIASRAEASSARARANAFSASSANGTMTSRNRSCVSSLCSALLEPGFTPAARRTSSLTFSRPFATDSSVSFVPSKCSAAARLTLASSSARNSTSGALFLSSFATKCSREVLRSTALTSVSRSSVSSRNPRACPRYVPPFRWFPTARMPSSTVTNRAQFLSSAAAAATSSYSSVTFLRFDSAVPLNTSAAMRAPRRGMGITCRKYCSTVASIDLSPG